MQLERLESEKAYYEFWDCPSNTTYTTNPDGSVTVKITSSEQLQYKDGWDMGSDEKSLTKTYNSNAKEIVRVLNTEGIAVEVEINVDSIRTVEDNTDEQKEENKGNTDDTQSDSPIPNAGSFIIPFAILAGVIFVVNRRKLKSMRYIK